MILQKRWHFPQSRIQNHVNHLSFELLATLVNRCCLAGFLETILNIFRKIADKKARKF